MLSLDSYFIVLGVFYAVWLGITLLRYRGHRKRKHKFVSYSFSKTLYLPLNVKLKVDILSIAQGFVIGIMVFDVASAIPHKVVHLTLDILVLLTLLVLQSMLLRQHAVHKLAAVDRDKTNMDPLDLEALEMDTPDAEQGTSAETEDSHTEETEMDVSLEATAEELKEGTLDETVLQDADKEAES